ncbi:MAG: PLP-dependent aminotransferase family protein [Anaerolineae bacterium]
MADRRVYDLKTGYPDLSLVPRERLSQFAQAILMQGTGLQYAGDAAGTAHARAQIAQFLTGIYHLAVDPSQIIVTTGALQSIDITCRALTAPGDVVIVESPTFYYAVTVIQACRVEIVGVPMGSEGIDLNALETIVRQYGGRVKVVYTIPVFHNPTGICASVANRRGLIALAARYGFTVLEDATYQPLYFGEPPPPLIQSFDEGGHVVTVASFSKLVMPGLRVGWVLAAPENIRTIKTAKGDGGASMFTTEIVASYLESGEFADQVEFARRFYAKKHDLMVAALDRYAPQSLNWNAPGGGYFVWGELAAGLSVEKLYTLAQARGVDFFPGSASFADGNDDSHLRLCFAYLPDSDIEPAVKLLCECLREL